MTHQENAPLSVIPGAIRFNTDSMKLEYYRGGPVGFGTTTQTGEWVNLTTDSPDIQTGGARGVFAVGSTGGSYDTTTQYITVDTTGNAVDFGDLTGTARGYGASFASRTRGVFAAGQNGGTNQNNIDYVTISSTGNATTFGGLFELVRYPTGFSNSTRGLIAGGLNPAATNTIQYVTIASTGNTIDFGDASGGTFLAGSSFASSTRGVFQRGVTLNLEFVTISTLGNAADFGNISNSLNGGVGVSNSIRGLFAGGYVTPLNINAIEYTTIASLGNATDFGDLTTARASGASSASSTRGVFIAGGAYPAGTNVIDYVQIMSTGNAIDFGDVIDSKLPLGAFGCSNGHGGLG